jgi:nicotinate dehydrogenase subunit A
MARAVTVTVDDPAIPLLYVLRENLELRGPRFGCGLGQCGTCMVLLDDEAVLSCEIKLSAVGEGKIVTLEGLGSPERPSPVQQAFIDEQSAMRLLPQRGDHSDGGAAREEKESERSGDQEGARR